MLLMATPNSMGGLPVHSPARPVPYSTVMAQQSDQHLQYVKQLEGRVESDARAINHLRIQCQAKDKEWAGWRTLAGHFEQDNQAKCAKEKELIRNIEQLRVECGELEAAIEPLREEKAEVDNQLAKAKRAIIALQTQVHDYYAQKEELASKAAEDAWMALDQHNKLEEEFKALEKEQEETVKTLHHERKQLTALDNQITTLRTQVGDLQIQNKKLVSKAEVDERKAGERYNESEKAFKGLQMEHEETIKAHEETTKAHEETIKAHEETVKTLQEEREQTAKQAQQELENKRKEFEAHTARQQKTVLCEQKARTIMNDALASVRAELLAEQESTSQKLADADSFLEESLNANQQLISDHTIELEKQTKALTKRNGEYNKCTEENVALDKLLKAEQEVSAGLRDKIAGLERQMDEVGTTVARSAEAATELFIRDFQARLPRAGSGNDGHAVTDAIGAAGEPRSTNDNADNHLLSPKTPSTPSPDAEQSAKSPSTESAIQQGHPPLTPSLPSSSRDPRQQSHSLPTPFSPSSRDPRRGGGRAGQLTGPKRQRDDDAQVSEGEGGSPASKRSRHGSQ